MNLPKDGWRYVSATDLKSVCGTCGLCGTPIRYVHRIEHIEADLVLDIGCECASNVINGEDLDYIQEQDKIIKSASRKAKAEADKLQKSFEEFNERQIKNNRTPFTYIEYLDFIEAVRIKNEESAKKKAQKRRK